LFSQDITLDLIEKYNFLDARQDVLFDNYKCVDMYRVLQNK